MTAENEKREKEGRDGKRGRKSDRERLNETAVGRDEGGESSRGGKTRRPTIEGARGQTDGVRHEHQLRASPNEEEEIQESLRGVRPLKDKGKHCQKF